MLQNLSMLPPVLPSARFYQHFRVAFGVAYIRRLHVRTGQVYGLDLRNHVFNFIIINYPS